MSEKFYTKPTQEQPENNPEMKSEKKVAAYVSDKIHGHAQSHTILNEAEKRAADAYLEFLKNTADAVLAEIHRLSEGKQTKLTSDFIQRLLFSDLSKEMSEGSRVSNIRARGSKIFKYTEKKEINSHQIARERNILTKLSASTVNLIAQTILQVGEKDLGEHPYLSDYITGVVKTESRD